nr:L-ornithine N(5)-monooxygenase [Verruciconidia persicina]
MAPHSEEVDYPESADSFIPSTYTNGGTTPSTNGHQNGTSNGFSNGTPNGTSNGHTKVNGKTKHAEKSQYLQATDPADEHDLICIGFGPASLAVAVAMHDAIASGQNLTGSGEQRAPRVLFLEKQETFAWHAGMLLPGAKMQISFVKDLATLRDPRSEFTFLNYLHRQGRLVDFTNLSTFLPARTEYEDYLRWSASFFDHVVRYSSEVVSVSPVEKGSISSSSVKSFNVAARNSKTGDVQTFRGRNVLIAAGGQPSLPKSFPRRHPRVIHSSQYAKVVPQLLPKRDAPYRVAVVGAGQSAAEIFNNVQNLYPNSKTYLIMRQEFLRPSDDSPFVNSVFNPEYIDNMFPRSAEHRHNLLAEARATNYGVVRLELIEHLYERMYDQRREIGADEKTWPHRILGGRQITSIEPSRSGESDVVDLKVQTLPDVRRAATLSGENGDATAEDDIDEIIQADLVIAATGYQRMAHVDMLRDAYDLLPKAAPVPAGKSPLRRGIAGWDVETDQGERKLAVGRNYQVKFKPGAVAEGSGVWLQGCCEGTHGLSDTLLSVLATRSGEMVESIFGKN